MQSKSKAALATEKALEEAKKNGADPATIAKLQRDVNKQRSEEILAVQMQGKSKASYASGGKILSQENVNDNRNHEASGLMANVLKKKSLKAEK